jgi:hypothetical protein
MSLTSTPPDSISLRCLAVCRPLLTGGAIASVEPLTAPNGVVRCTVDIGYEGGSTAANQQTTATNLNGFVAYGQITNTGLKLETDQLPAVNNFDGVNPIWPLGKLVNHA